MSDPSPPSQGDISLQQTTTSDRNQTIGQVLGGMVVYVSGGQAIINTGREEPTPDEKAIPLGSNPYKGLMAFQETDGDRFFGREKQVAALWEKLRSLHETESAIRVLPIYGPSGSGKSSLARAGLIPELARHPIPGYDRARVAILVPGTHSLESLATVLARIVTQDLTPVAKTREFAGELKQVNEAEEYDGLRRIADAMPDIAIAPLVVLVDQFEEVYTLCDDKTERDAFIGNLLHAAGARAKRVTVIVTLRSDFLGETQKHAVLNRLFSEQGYLVPAMTPEELRQAIAKPAELAGHPLDTATIDLLVKDTEGREGALPLLQFALTRIWEGLAEGKQPAETLKAIGGVGGALAGEAQRIYDSLDDEEKAIARRLFLGLVQLGEGTKDTRRRAVLDSLVSYQDQPAQVKQVIGLFVSPGVRLITLSASSNTETAEVTHEALFDHWKQLQAWLESSRSDIRFQRRLDEAARYWDEQGRPEGNLWRAPDLNLLEHYFHREGGNMTPLQVTFFKVSKQAENHRERLRRLGIGGLIAGFTVMTGLAVFSFYQMQRAERQRVEQLGSTGEALSSTKPVNAVITAIASVELSQSPLIRLSNNKIPLQVISSLLSTIQADREINSLLHNASVVSVAFNSNSSHIVSGSLDGTVWLWDVKRGQVIGQPLRGHGKGVTSVAFSSDDQTIISGSLDKTVRLWNVSTGQPAGQPLQGHRGEVKAVAFSPDSQRIVSASLDKTVRLWAASTGQPIGQPLQGHGDGVISVAFSPDGKQVVSGSYDRTIRLWDASTGKPIGQPLYGHGDQVISVAFSPDSQRIVSASLDKTVRLWAASTGQPIGQPLQGHGDGVISVAFSPDGKQVVSGSYDRTIRLWDASTGKPIGQPLYGHEAAIRAVTFSRDGQQIASGSLDSTVRLWDNSLDQSFGPVLQGHEAKVFSVDFSPTSELVASGSNDNTIRLWNILTGQSDQSLHGHEDAVLSIAFSPDGRRIASASLDKTIRLWDVVNHQPIGQPFRGHEDAVISVAFSPDGKWIVSGSYDRTIRLWDTATGQPIGQPLHGHEDEVRSVAFSPNGKWIASGSYDRTIRLWDTATGQQVGQPLRGHEDAIESVAFSPDGRWIVSGSFDRTIRLWDVTTGQQVRNLRGHENQVRSVAFSPDGRWIVSGSFDRTIRLWDVTTGQQVGQPLRGHEDRVVSVAFSPDAKLIVSGSYDKTARLWVVSWEGLLDAACQKVRYHSSLIAPTTDIARAAQRTCQRYAWSN